MLQGRILSRDPDSPKFGCHESLTSNQPDFGNFFYLNDKQEGDSEHEATILFERIFLPQLMTSKEKGESNYNGIHFGPEKRKNASVPSRVKLH